MQKHVYACFFEHNSTNLEIIWMIIGDRLFMKKGIAQNAGKYYIVIKSTNYNYR